MGILCVGHRGDRARLGSAPVVQFIKYDEKGKKINKLTWDDYSLNPWELVSVIWDEIPDWRDSYEFPDGLYRQKIPHYDATVVRELLINALGFYGPDSLVDQFQQRRVAIFYGDSIRPEVRV